MDYLIDKLTIELNHDNARDMLVNYIKEQASNGEEQFCELNDLLEKSLVWDLIDVGFRYDGENKFTFNLESVD